MIKKELGRTRKRILAFVLSAIMVCGVWNVPMSGSNMVYAADATRLFEEDFESDSYQGGSIGSP